MVKYVNRAIATSFHNFDVSWLLRNTALYQLVSMSTMLLTTTRARNAARLAIGAVSFIVLLTYRSGPYAKGAVLTLLAHFDLHGFADYWYCYALLPLLLPSNFLEAEHQRRALTSLTVSTTAHLAGVVLVFAACLAIHRMVFGLSRQIFRVLATSLTQFLCLVILTYMLPSKPSILSDLGHLAFMSILVSVMVLPHLDEILDPPFEFMSPFGLGALRWTLSH